MDQALEELVPEGAEREELSAFFTPQHIRNR